MVVVALLLVASTSSVAAGARGYSHGSVTPDRESIPLAGVSLERCPLGNTVCPAAVRHGGTCCPNEFEGQGSCCIDGLTCCAHGYRCADRACVAINSTAHPLAQQTPRYQLCRGPAEVLFLRDLPKGTGKRFPYYSSRKQLGYTDSGMLMAAVVVHGAGRNADDYFCAMHATANMQRSFDPSTVGVFAPRFWEPQDGPAAGSLYWNGSDPNGVWRFGADAVDEPISSYDVLDAIIGTLLNQSLYPELKQLTLVGHSSGGQTVQRYALSTKMILDSRVRYVVANPSSFAYLDSTRWLDQGKFTERLARPPAPVIENCPGYNEWEWGLACGGETTSYVNCDPTTTRHYISQYKMRDVRYLIGGSDVCNEAMTPGCHSHGLETTCMDMLQGYNRRYRAEHYVKHLANVFGHAVHNSSVVPGVGHDHSLMFESLQGQALIFGPPYS